MLVSVFFKESKIIQSVVLILFGGSGIEFAWEKLEQSNLWTLVSLLLGIAGLLLFLPLS